MRETSRRGRSPVGIDAAHWRVFLFGQFRVEHDGENVCGFSARKVQELFAYLLLHRERAHSREVLAEALWRDYPGEQSRKYLRQALWRLQAALGVRMQPRSQRVVLAEAERIGINPEGEVWVDVEELERAFSLFQERPEAALEAASIAVLERAVQEYRGDLLEGCYLDWCLRRREQFLEMYFAILEALVRCCERRGRYETGLVYASRILHRDRASERTHRHVMRLQYLTGDRTGALRQYRRCASALIDELGVQPSHLTQALYEQIKADQVEGRPSMVNEGPSPASEGQPLSVILDSLKQLQDTLDQMQTQLWRRA